jgi:hypothetical protein
MRDVWSTGGWGGVGLVEILPRRLVLIGSRKRARQHDLEMAVIGRVEHLVPSLDALWLVVFSRTACLRGFHVRPLPRPPLLAGIA